MNMPLRAAAYAAAGILASAGIAATASASFIVIDDFTSVDAANPWPVMLNAVGNTTINESGLSALGGTRQTYIEATSIGIPGLDFLQVAIAPGAGLFDFNSTVDTDGYLSLLYNGGGSLNADFVGKTSVELAFALFDHAGAAPLPVTVSLSDGVNTATHTLALNAPGGQTLSFNFSDFANIGLLDLSAIQSIQFDLDPAVGADFRISQIIAVPTPAAIGLLAIGMAVPRRRRK